MIRLPALLSVIAGAFAAGLCTAAVVTIYARYHRIDYSLATLGALTAVGTVAAASRIDNA